MCVLMCVTQWCGQDERCHRLQLPDLLISPMQHCTKVPLLLHNIGRYTHDDVEQQMLTESLRTLETSLGTSATQYYYTQPRPPQRARRVYFSSYRKQVVLCKRVALPLMPTKNGQLPATPKHVYLNTQQYSVILRVHRFNVILNTNQSHTTLFFGLLQQSELFRAFPFNLGIRHWRKWFHVLFVYKLRYTF